MIEKCFRKSGIFDISIVQYRVLTKDPVSCLGLHVKEDQEDPELLRLMKQTHGNDHCSLDTCSSADNSIPTCTDIDNEECEEHFVAELVPSSSKQLNTTENVEGDDASEAEYDEFLHL